MSAKFRGGSVKFRLADWGRRQRSGSTPADHLLMHLTALCNTSHRCTLSDNGIAAYFGLKKRSVSRHLSTLRARELVAVHFQGPGRTKRVITFCFPSDDSHSGVAPAPEWRSNQRHDGGENPKEGILSSEAEREGYLRLCSLPEGHERIAAFKAFHRDRAKPEGQT